MDNFNSKIYHHTGVAFQIVLFIKLSGATQLILWYVNLCSNSPTLKCDKFKFYLYNINKKKNYESWVYIIGPRKHLGSSHRLRSKQLTNWFAINLLVGVGMKHIYTSCHKVYLCHTNCRMLKSLESDRILKYNMYNGHCTNWS